MKGPFYTLTKPYRLSPVSGPAEGHMENQQQEIPKDGDNAGGKGKGRETLFLIIMYHLQKYYGMQS